MSLPEVKESQRNCYGEWTTSAEYHSPGLEVCLAKFLQVMNMLLEQPSMTSTHSLRANIVYDSAQKVQAISASSCEAMRVQFADAPRAPLFRGFVLERTVIQRLIPYEPQTDRPLERSCFVYAGIEPRSGTDQLVVYTSHVTSEAQLPGFLCTVHSLAYHFKQNGSIATIAVHYKPFTAAPRINPHVHRTLLSLLQTTIRLTKADICQEPLKSPTTKAVAPHSTLLSALKLPLLPQHVVQDTYARLKHTYGTELINRWVDKADPSKHIFEDLAIAAFLIELWTQIYSNVPFPGFVDFACGNGVLVYVLVKEGFPGKGFDARRRETWTVLGMDDHIEEIVCVPGPFLDLIERRTAAAAGEEGEREKEREGKENGIRSQIPVPIHTGIFKPGTFIISNHADELTPWVPILAALSDPSSPLPFLAIPCCSHTLSGARHRYTPQDVDPSFHLGNTSYTPDPIEQSTQGDLRALRAEKQRARAHADENSQYACLTKKIAALAEEVGFDVEMTLMPVSGPRNIGIVGNRQHVGTHGRQFNGTRTESDNGDGKKDCTEIRFETENQTRASVARILTRECIRDGGVEAAARTWIQGVKKLCATNAGETYSMS